MLTDNSHIILDKDDTLICHTDKPDCCHSNEEGQWYIPDGLRVLKNDPYFTVSRNNEGTINITFTTINFGMFCCQVPNVDDANKTVCINSG